MLDFVLACARKEPHYRIYFLAFAWYYAGKTLLRPDCDAPAGSATPEPFVSIPIFLYPSSPRNNYFCHLSSALWTLCKRHWVSFKSAKNWDRRRLPDRYLDGMSVLWLATQSHASLRLIQVSVKRERTTYGLPLFVPVSR